MLLTTNFEMTEKRRRRPKVVPRAAADFIRQLKMISFLKKIIKSGVQKMKMTRMMMIHPRMITLYY